MRAIVRLIALVALASCLLPGCKGQESVEQPQATAPATQPLQQQPADAMEELAALPGVGEKLVIQLPDRLSMNAETEPLDFDVIEIDEELLGRIGLPAYPQAVGLRAMDAEDVARLLEGTGLAAGQLAAGARSVADKLVHENIVLMATTDSTDQVREFYLDARPGAEDLSDVYGSIMDGMFALAEEVPSESELHGEPPDPARADLDGLRRVYESGRSLVWREGSLGVDAVAYADPWVTVIRVAALSELELGLVDFVLRNRDLIADQLQAVRLAIRDVNHMAHESAAHADAKILNVASEAHRFDTGQRCTSQEDLLLDSGVPRWAGPYLPEALRPPDGWEYVCQDSEWSAVPPEPGTFGTLTKDERAEVELADERMSRLFSELPEEIRALIDEGLEHDARASRVLADIKILNTASIAYEVETGLAPTCQEDLVTDPGVPDWGGPYLESVYDPPDGWEYRLDENGVWIAIGPDE